MEQRIYSSPITPEGLADHLVQRFDQTRGIRAQKVGKDNSFVVQIGPNDIVLVLKFGKGNEPNRIQHAVSLAIAERSAGAGVSVTMGERKWVTAGELQEAAIWSLMSFLLTPLALVGLIGPLSRVFTASGLPRDIWTAVDLYAAASGGTQIHTETRVHPHLS